MKCICCKDCLKEWPSRLLINYCSGLLNHVQKNRDYQGLRAPGRAAGGDRVSAARAVGAHDFIAGLLGLDTQIGERGVQLSAGQRQLVAFARALVADPRLLILDEATANVDIHTESKIEDGLRRLLAGRTAIVIAHRLSTIREPATSSSSITARSPSRAPTTSSSPPRRLRALYRDWAEQAAALAASRLVWSRRGGAGERQRRH